MIKNKCPIEIYPNPDILLIGPRTECNAEALARDLCRPGGSNASHSILSHGNVLQAGAHSAEWPQRCC